MLLLSVLVPLTRPSALRLAFTFCARISKVVYRKLKFLGIGSCI